MPQPIRRPARHARRVLATAAAAALVAGCGASVKPADSSAPSSASPPSTSATPTPSATPSPTPQPTPSSTAVVSSSAARSSTVSIPSTHPVTPTPHRTTSTSVAPPASGAPVIVIDPGHSRTVSATDPKTGLNVSDYENEPEMRDVWAVSLLVRSKLQAAGYRVVMTKDSLDQKRDLAARAEIANAAHASLALSIHDQAGSNGGIGFRSGNNIVYYQKVGDYRSTASGHKVVFTDASLAAVSKRYAEQFAAQREKVQGVSINLQGDTGYNLGSRGLAPGNIWIVQLLSTVPWIYNEAGGNSAGRSGLNSSDEQTYADSLVAGVEHCIAPPR